MLVETVSDHFTLPGIHHAEEEIHSGHINGTYYVTRQLEDNSEQSFILQRINRSVFANAEAVMRNIQLVTQHISQKSPHTLRLIPTRDGLNFYESADRDIWRCYPAIEDCVTYDIVTHPRQAHAAAHAFGTFQKQLADMDASLITETIPDFHHTPKRYVDLLDAIAHNSMDRVKDCSDEIALIQARKDELDRLTSHPDLPIRITHNDTKINNVMIDPKTDKAVCVIDLDTVMPGLSLYDFGDLVRTATSPAAEDETDLSRVELRLDYYEAIVEGYLLAAEDILTKAEIELLSFSSKLITLEVAIRFLTDYLRGDTYFKISHPQHNLKRAKNQLALALSMEKQMPQMEDIVLKKSKHYRKNTTES